MGDRMENLDKINELNQLIKLNLMPIVIEKSSYFNDYLKIKQPKFTTIDARLSAKALGLDGSKFNPQWYTCVMNYESAKTNLLIISNFNSLLDDQMKFYELFKYRKASNFVLPLNCTIIITLNELDNNNILENINSLVCHFN